METVNQENATNNQVATEEKTFSQAELDAIVSDRLKRERSKYEGFDELKAKAAKLDELEEASKSELQKATEKAEALEAELNGLKKAESVRDIRDKVATETGVPAAMLHQIAELATKDDEDSFKALANIMIDYAKNNGGYPVVKDGGEVTNTTKLSTRQQFAEWFEDKSN